MISDEKFDSMMEDINYHFFWHELGNDREAMAYYPPTHALHNLLHFYEDYLRSDDPLGREGVEISTAIGKVMDFHASGRTPARLVLRFVSELAATAAKNTPARFRHCEQPKPIPARVPLKPTPASVAPKPIPASAQPKPTPAPIPRPTPVRLQELRERNEEADRNFYELVHEEDALEAARKKKKRCKRKSKAQRRKPPPYDLDVHDGGEIIMDGAPPPAYTPD